MNVNNGVLNYNIESDSFISGVSTLEIARYLKGLYNSNFDRYEERFLNFFKEAVVMYDRPDRIVNLELVSTYFKLVQPYTYLEAFKIDNDEFRAIVFGSINIVEMITNLGATRVEVKGLPVKHRQYKEDGTFNLVEYDVIYELHKIDGSKLEIEDELYAVKCWCTSTNKEHWLWVEDTYAEKGILEAVASLARVYENMIPYIKCLKRHGDVLIFEMTEDIKPEGNIIPLTAEQYFKLLIAQS